MKKMTLIACALATGLMAGSAVADALKPLSPQQRQQQLLNNPAQRNTQQRMQTNQQLQQRQLEIDRQTSAQQQNQQLRTQMQTDQQRIQQNQPGSK
ncbi:hypothetical protein CYR40_17895 [Chimaeribacter arupi]|uniref:DUF2756 domain-containing protein n=2 Tax=Yersiniaceae TaxID=1903411 RepID=A0A2N5EI20_9GAMM|nr:MULTISPECIES: DUF2756 domain-containing protein [Yersiniaceae]MDV5141742.1 DUF2756 domain-containing protein [Chimaeribacter arupi]PLR42754.1 hypothetical protein CYR52_20920 [Chimaeribacter arupi]PLR43251.1 hypothetical protein CYR40_17895 [Chimaeribacter arupi]PLR44189.1 hypothetical protein CYR34_19570 [Chimaeribacter arupi]WKZ92162.1 DUF2756 domain-containing protein [Chimaeribacter arupi]